MVAKEVSPPPKPKASGAEADRADHAFRAVHPSHWVEGKPTSAAFRTSNPFSVFLQSGLTENGSLDDAGQTCVSLLEANTLGDIDPTSAVVGFNCGKAAAIGFATHLERQEHEHPSHAHIYCCDAGKKPPKSKAKDLRDLASKHIVRSPTSPNV